MGSNGKAYAAEGMQSVRGGIKCCCPLAEAIDPVSGLMRGDSASQGLKDVWQRIQASQIFEPIYVTEQIGADSVDLS